jgi:FdhD protein
MTSGDETSDPRLSRRVVTVIGPPDQGKMAAREQEQAIVRETPLTLVLNGVELLTLVTTGDANRELALGFLLSEGFLREKKELTSLREDPAGGAVEVTLASEPARIRELWEKRTVTSGCGKGATFYRVLDALAAAPLPPGPTVTPAQVLSLMEELNRRSALYRETRGVHNSALAEPEKLLLFRDDIGRHNAIDKIHGAAFLGDVPLAGKLLLTTGRLTSEVVVKAARMGVPLLVSRSAATTLAIELAERVGMTLVGYVRGGQMVVYCGRERVK